MIAIVPARGGSKGLPGKNIRPLGGKPLIAYTVEEALKARGIDKVVVSTDDPQIAEIAVDFGAICPFMRPADLASDESLAIDTYLYTVDRLERELGYQIEDVVILLPTSPLRLASDIEAAMSLFQEKNAESVVSYVKEAHPISWHREIDSEQRLHPLFAENLCNRQETKETYYPNGSIYVFNMSLLRQRKYYSDKSFAYVMPAERSVDIDNHLDFLFAEFLIGLREAR